MEKPDIGKWIVDARKNGLKDKEILLNLGVVKEWVANAKKSGLGARAIIHAIENDFKVN